MFGESESGQRGIDSDSETEYSSVRRRMIALIRIHPIQGIEIEIVTVIEVNDEAS